MGMGHVNYKTAKAILINGFAIVSANDCQNRDPFEFRLYGRTVLPKAEGAPPADLLKNEHEIEALKDFVLLKHVE